MFVYFAKNLYTSLIHDKFSLVPYMYDSLEFDNSTKYMGLSKNIGSVLYVVVIANLDTMSIDEFKVFSGDFKKRLKKNSTFMNLRNTFIFNVLVSSNDINEDTKNFVDLTENFFGQSILTSNIAVDLSKEKIYSTVEDDFINIETHIKNSFSDSHFFVTPEPFENIIKKELSLTSIAPVADKNILVFLLIIVYSSITLSMQLQGGSTNINILVQHGALVPSMVFENNEYFRLLTSTFLHAGLPHLIFNCISLYIFGNLAEKYLGVSKFALIYFFSGLASSIFMLFFMPSISIGAAGAICGLMGALLAVSRKTGKYIGNFSTHTLLLYTVSIIGLSFLMPNTFYIMYITGLGTGYLLGHLLYTSEKSL